MKWLELGSGGWRMPINQVPTYKPLSLTHTPKTRKVVEKYLLFFFTLTSEKNNKPRGPNGLRPRQEIGIHFAALAPAAARLSLEKTEKEKRKGARSLSFLLPLDSYYYYHHRNR